MRERAAVVLVGNHDLAAIGKLATSDFGPLAAESAHWTERALGAEQAGWLRTLEPAAIARGPRALPRKRRATRCGNTC